MEKQATGFDCSTNSRPHASNSLLQDYIWHRTGIIVVWITHTFQGKISTTMPRKEVCLYLPLFIETILTGSRCCCPALPSWGKWLRQETTSKTKKKYNLPRAISFCFPAPFGSRWIFLHDRIFSASLLKYPQREGSEVQPTRGSGAGGP